MNEVPNIILLWTDIETTGLDYEDDIILELAWQFTDYLGNPLSEPRSYLTVDVDDTDMVDRVLNRYRKTHPAAKQTHLNNGLWNDILFGVSEEERADFFTVLDRLYGDLDKVRGDAEVRLAGSSVGFDKRFIETVYGGELPISHRVHDLSTFRPFFKWQGLDLNEHTEGFVTDSHRAAADIERDIAQWRGLISVVIEGE